MLSTGLSGRRADRPSVTQAEQGRMLLWSGPGGELVKTTQPWRNGGVRPSSLVDGSAFFRRVDSVADAVELMVSRQPDYRPSAHKGAGSR